VPPDWFLRILLKLSFLAQIMQNGNLNRLLYVVISAIALSPVVMAPTGCSKPPVAARIIPVAMKKYSIAPAEIHIKQGETVEFHVSATDVQHGFDVPELGIKQSVQPSHPAIFSFTADRKGEFEIKCGILCGAGHDRMRGKMVVQ
jgi:heme/copper-type cytochrome/quinol oxidase subunit 2